MQSPHSSAEGALERAPQRDEAPPRVATGVRVLVATLASLGICLAAGLDAAWQEGFVYAAVGAAMVIVGLAELTETAGRLGVALNRSLLVLGGAALFLLHWAGLVSGAFPDPWMLAMLTLAALATGTLVGRVLHGRIDGALAALCGTAGALLYVPGLLGFLTAVRIGWGISGVLTLVAVCKGSSIGAFVAGKSLGRLRLAPRVSPAKTVEGAVGGMLFAVGVAWLMSISLWSIMGGTEALVFGLLVGGAAMLGDLAASLLKREAGLKDFGRLLPGLGGMLDLIDDLLFAAPVAYMFLLYLGLIGRGG